jgi:hypothetical protein
MGVAGFLLNESEKKEYGIAFASKSERTSP